jgi:lipopolysaccharide heptosyltransferase I
MALSRILIIKLSSLGDVVQSLPVAGALRRRFPGSEISWLVRPPSAGVVVICRHVDRVFVWDPRRRPRLETVIELRAHRPQVSLDLQGLPRSAALAWLSGAPWRIGFRSWHEGAFALCNLRLIAPREDIHAVDGYLQFARRLGAQDGPADFGIHVPDNALHRADQMLRQYRSRSVVALLPGTRWPSKQWPARHFAALAVALRDMGVATVVLGDRNDRAAGAEIVSAAGAHAHDFTGRTSLVESAAIIARCDAAVGNDSGATHLAAALGAPVVALFGPTDPARTGPYGAGHTVLQPPVPCRACRRRRCAVSCMERISPSRALEAVRRTLAEAMTTAGARASRADCAAVR